MVDPKVGDSAPRRRSAVANTAANYGTQLAGAALGLCNVLVVSRALGPEGRGAVAFIMTMTMLVSLLATMGVQWAIPNFGGRDRRLLPALAGNSVVLSFVLGALAIGLVSLSIEFVPAIGGHVDPGTRWLGLASVPLVILGYYLYNVAMSEYRFGLMNSALLVAPVVNVVVNGTAAALGVLSVRIAVLSWVIGQTLATLLVAWYVHRRLGGFGRPDARLARGMVGFGIKAHAGQVGMISNYRLDQWLLGSLASAKALGLYSVAVAWAEVLFFLPQAVMTVQRPDLVRANRKDASRQAAIGFRAVVLIMTVSVLVIVLAAPFLCVTIFGEEFRGSVRDLRILALGAFGIVAMKQLGAALTAQRKPLLETAGIVVAFAVTVGTDVALIPSHSDLGASIASTLSYTAGGLAMAAIFVRALGGRLSDLLPRGSELRWRTLSGDEG